MSDNLKHLVLRFGKTLNPDPSILNKENIHCPLYIALGYYDTLQLYLLPMTNKDSYLKSICKHNLELSSQQNIDIYFHTIHCTACDDMLDNVQTFLEFSTSYVFITLLQKRDIPDQETDDEWESYIYEHLFNNIGSPDSSDISWLLCKSITLSDLIIIWKSNSIQAILNAIQKVYSSSFVGDSHSIPSILMNSITQEKGAPFFQEEDLKQVIIRYMVRDTQAAYNFFKQLDVEPPAFTIGIEDLTFVTKTWNTKMLQYVLNQRLTNSEYLEQFTKAFSECETHLGDILLPSKEEPPNTVSLNNRCSELLIKFQDYHKRLVQKTNIELDGPWLKAASELYHALFNLSRDTIADGYCFLVLDAASTFLEQLSEIDKPLNSDQLLRVNHFLSGWDNLMEQVLRTDGKFFQQPGFSHPSLCDIPSYLLEFYLSFTSIVGKAMQLVGGDYEHFSLLLIPKLCRRIKVKPIFSQYPPYNRILHVDIPIFTLYDPSTVLCHLIHEISHFIGDGWRLRPIRAQQYFFICARELAEELSFHDREVMKQIRIRLSRSSHSSQSSEYLDALFVRMRDELEKLLNDEETLEKWINIENTTSNALDKHVDQLKIIQKIDRMRHNISLRPNDPTDSYFNIINEFQFLFRECYADLTMCFILNITPEKYLEMISQEWELYKRTNDVKAEKYHLNVERWSIVLHALNSNLDSILSVSLNSEFVDDVKRCSKFLFDFTDSLEEDIAELEGKYHRPESVEYLYRYLRKCHAFMKITERKSLKGDLKYIRDVFDDLMKTDNVFTPQCQNIISHYRRLILNL